MLEGKRIKLDVKNTPPKQQYTVVECEHCGVFYEPYGKPHKCKRKEAANE